MESTSLLDFSMDIEMVGLYNSRNLTCPQEALTAISGVLTGLKRGFPSGFVSGLPIMYLDIALLWQPFSKAERPLAKDGGFVAPVRHLPSWSWCGWQCPIDPFVSRSMTTHICEDTKRLQGPVWQTYGLVDWYVMSEDMQIKWGIDQRRPIPEQETPITENDTIYETRQSQGGEISHTLCHVDLQEPTPIRESSATVQVQNPKLDNEGKHYSQRIQNDCPYLSCETTHACFIVKAVLKAGARASRGKKASKMMLSAPIVKLSRFSRSPSLMNMCDLICLENDGKNSAGVPCHMTDVVVKAGDVVELVATSTGSVTLAGLNSQVLGNLVTQARQSQADRTWSSELNGE